MSVHDHRFALATPAVIPLPNERLWRTVFASWALVSVVLLSTCASAIWRGLFPDPDDAMRLLEVRDLLNGQSWWDVDQHRLASGMMHWSRLVDLPLAAVEIIARAIVGPGGAERVALVIVPLLTLGCVMTLGAALTRRLLDAERAGRAMLIGAMSVPLLQQLRPMRIDHHGWQVALAMAALLAFVTRRSDARSGAIGGICVAALLTISLEGLPIAAALIGIVALGWVVDASRKPQLVATTGTAFAGSVLFHLATRGPHFWVPACDAMAPVWLAALGTAAAGTSIITILPVNRAQIARGGAGIMLRLAAMAAVGVAAGTTVLLVDPRCAAGPFSTLPPLVRQLWYYRVLEGLPIWRQSLGFAVMNVALPVVGLAGSVLALRNATGDRRAAWWITLGALTAAFALSLLVSRSAATANAFALPGASLVVVALLARARRIRGLLHRTVATLGALLVAAPGVAAMALLALPDDGLTLARRSLLDRSSHVPCTRPEDVRALGSLPAGVVFAPIDIAPEIIVWTRHRAIASGHHRNAQAMADVLAAFTASPERAEAIIRGYHANYVVGCPGNDEALLYDQNAPEGFWARLERGERFEWLEPVRVSGSPVLAWRVTPLPESSRRL